MPEAQMTEALITDEMIENMRKKIGIKLRIEKSVFNDDATRLAIIKFADGVGDVNPLWHDPEYAEKTRYGRIVAPPSWVIGCFCGEQFGWPGLAGYHSGAEIEFLKPVFLGDKISSESIFDGFEGPKPSKFAKRMIIDYYTNNYINQVGELVSRSKWYVIRVERKQTKKEGKYSKIELPHPWTEDELKRIEEEVLSEEIRGATPRYWEDVNVGEELKPIVKGPFGITDMIAYIIGGGVPIPRMKAHGSQLREYRRHPAWSFRDPNSNALEPIFAVHYNTEAAKAMGLPYPYNVGWQSHCWQIHLLTNWMGDDGWLKMSKAQYRGFVYFSDVLWLRGKVVKKYIDESGDHCVYVETSAINQRDENIIPGSATIALPSREKGTGPLDSRLK